MTDWKTGDPVWVAERRCYVSRTWRSYEAECPECGRPYEDGVGCGYWERHEVGHVLVPVYLGKVAVPMTDPVWLDVREPGRENMVRGGDASKRAFKTEAECRAYAEEWNLENASEPEPDWELEGSEYQ